MRPWQPSPAKAVLALALPIFVVVYIAYLLWTTDFMAFVDVMAADPVEMTKIIVGGLALTFWVTRYSVPSAKFLLQLDRKA